jgi:menaquinone-dependent protoporphyrinogen oxidase
MEEIMSNSVLVTYATTDGSTKEVAVKIAGILRDRGLEPDIQPVKAVKTLVNYRAIVLGAPLKMYRLHKDARDFLWRFQKDLPDMKVAFFVLGPTHDPYDEKEWEDSRVQLDKEMERYPYLNPVALELFGGKYDPKKLVIPARWFAGKTPASDIRDWEKIRVWAESLPPYLTY